MSQTLAVQLKHPLDVNLFSCPWIVARHIPVPSIWGQHCSHFSTPWNLTWAGFLSTQPGYRLTGQGSALATVGVLVVPSTEHCVLYCQTRLHWMTWKDKSLGLVVHAVNLDSVLILTRTASASCDYCCVTWTICPYTFGHSIFPAGADDRSSFSSKLEARDVGRWNVLRLCKCSFRSYGMMNARGSRITSAPGAPCDLLCTLRLCSGGFYTKPRD
ncbi:hypothetical protein CCMA1212_004480 [Trichoderma ghanense]|uniref:Uncharacterized protein n=1 Tax=Trichoderma ghanense TaxID=65468 RepID=A0ABY2H796_9HYPO